MVIAANVWGKLKTIFQMVGLTFVLINDLGLDQLLHLENNYYIGQIIIYIATFISVISGVVYLIQNRQVFSEMK